LLTVQVAGSCGVFGKQEIWLVFRKFVQLILLVCLNKLVIGLITGKLLEQITVEIFTARKRWASWIPKPGVCR
jgi:hypothetical protein